MNAFGPRGSERGQMTVELAVVLPVIVVVMVIAIDCLVYIGQCARFDNLAAQRVIALANSPGSESYETEARVEAVEEALSEDFSDWDQTVEVECDSSGGADVYRCTLSFPPWPLSASGGSLFGTAIPAALEHEYALAIDQYTPGDL